MAAGVHANGDPINATLRGAQPDAGACERSCALGERACTVFTWNQHSHHCYHRADAVWTPSAPGWASDHTVADCA